MVELFVLEVAYRRVWLVEAFEEAIAPERAIVTLDVVVDVSACATEILDVLVGLEVAGDQLDDLFREVRSALSIRTSAVDVLARKPYLNRRFVECCLLVLSDNQRCSMSAGTRWLSARGWNIEFGALLCNIHRRTRSTLGDTVVRRKSSLHHGRVVRSCVGG